MSIVPRRAVATLACLLLGSTSASAVDAQAFADRLVEALSNETSSVAFGEARAEGEDVVLTEMVVTSSGEPIRLGDVRFETVTGSSEAGWEVERVPFEAYESTHEGSTVAIGDSVIEGLTINGTATAEGEEVLSEIYFDNATLGAVEVSEGGETAFTLTGTQVTNEETADGGIDTRFTFGDFFVDLTTGDAEGIETVRALGYEELNGSISGAGSWSPEDGTLSLDAFDISVEDAGEFSMAYAIDGYTQAFIASLAQLQTQLTSGGADDNATGMAILGLVSQLSVDSAEIAYTDDSLADKLLDYYAEQNNQTREELVASLTGALPLLLGYLQNPEFQAEVAGAVETFLSDPQSLTIAIAPENPVAVTQIIGAAMGAPQTLPAVLSLEVTANEAQ